jgi:hypothetical protein
LEEKKEEENDNLVNEAIAEYKIEALVAKPEIPKENKKSEKPKIAKQHLRSKTSMDVPLETRHSLKKPK